MTSLLEKFHNRYGRLPTEVDPDYLEMLRMTKYRILPIPDVGTNAKCANCGSAKVDGRKYVDFGLDVEWYGPVYLCGLCVKDIARAMGTFDKYIEQITQLIARVNELTLAREDALRLHETVLKTADELKEHYARLHALGFDNYTDSDLNPDIAEETSESGVNNSKSGETSPESNGPELPVIESTAKPGRKNPPSLKQLLENSGS